jgi:hypothetical protein
MSEAHPQPPTQPSSPQPAPPPLPPPTVDYRTPGLQQPQPSNPGLENYQRVADTVGMVPSLRWKDNVIQLIAVIAGTIAGAGIGFVIAGGRTDGAVIGAILGLVAALFISGIVLMILGWMRARKR